MNLFLIGLMGSGKSAVGRLLAEKLGRPFVDTDAQVEECAGLTIPEIFAREGESSFREREAAAIAQVAQGDHQVVATGGGAVLRPENRERLRSAGLVIWLTASPEALLERARGQGIATRPLLAGDDPLGRLRSLAASREVAYAETAHLRIDTEAGSVESVTDAVINRLREEESSHGRGMG